MAEVKLITGKINSGKSTFAEAYMIGKQLSGESTAGFLSDAEYVEGKKDRYFLRNIRTNTRTLAVSAEKESDDLKTYGFSRFYFSETAYKNACDVLTAAVSSSIILIDEIGPLELNGYGFTPALKFLLKTFTGELLLVVRKDALEKVLSYYAIAAEYEILRY